MSTGPTWRGTDGWPYLQRVLDGELDEKAAEFAAISIKGPNDTAISKRSHLPAPSASGT